LLVETMLRYSVRGSRVADLCTGSGAVAIAAGRSGASAVSAFDLSADAVHCARMNAIAAQIDIDVHLGSCSRAVEFGPYDMVVCNPPYVPHCPDVAECVTQAPELSYDGGPDGRSVLDPLCALGPSLLVSGGVLLVVQSEFADVAKTIAALEHSGLDAGVVAQRRVPFGPVMQAGASWLERTGRLTTGVRHEWISVIAGVTR
jgi:release factor glutamine methyltransferase